MRISTLLGLLSCLVIMLILTFTGMSMLSGEGLITVYFAAFLMCAENLENKLS
jgi:hypothetical protein